jgi:predicted TIM-barrel fold metal-dependent hydrolase
MRLDHDFDVIDGHHHYGNLFESMAGFGGGRNTEPPPDFDELELAARLAILDEQNVRQAVIIAGHAYLRPEGLADTRRVNDGVAAYRDRRPDRFPAAVGVVEPLYGRAGLPEIDRCRNELGMVGISFHVRFQGVSMDSPWVHRYVERMGEVGLIPYLHAIGDSPEEALWKIDDLAADFPDLTGFVLDAFSNFEQARQVIAIADRRPRLFFDTALAYNFDLVMPAIRRFGADRFLYGSDIYSWPLVTRPSHLLAQILESDLTRGEKEQIVGANLRALLSLV